MKHIDHNKFFRTAQTHFPLFSEIKPWLQQQYGRYTNKPFEADFNALRLFPAERLYIDVGANRGQSIAAIRMTAKNPRIVSFDANPFLAEKLRIRFGKWDDVKIHFFGLGAIEGEFTLYIPKYRNYVFDGLASIDYDEAMSWLSNKTIYNFDQSKLTFKAIKCRLKTFDSFDLAPFFMKLDIQGYELSALQGAERTLINHAPILLTETPSEALCEYVNKFGYRPYFFYKKFFYPGNNFKLNLFFMTDDKASLVEKYIKD
jgi:FkbM family methyltransferase